MGDDCLACALAAGRKPLPGGRIHRTDFWLVEHCVGPLGLGTLIVKPERHVTAVADLSPAEAVELGPLLHQASRVASRLVDAQQVYNCLWSHAGGVPVHFHFVVQPVTRQHMATYGSNGYGPGLQMAMFEAGITPDASDIATVADQARRLFALSRQGPPCGSQVFGPSAGLILLTDLLTPVVDDHGWRLDQPTAHSTYVPAQLTPMD